MPSAPCTKLVRTRWLIALACAAGVALGPGCRARYAACDDTVAWCERRNAEASGGSSAAGHPGRSGGASLGGLGGSAPATSGPVGHLGEPCSNEGEPACAGHASRFPLRCEDGVWVGVGQCSFAERCATEGGAIGTCQEAIPECLGHEPGDWVCADAERFRCGTDLLHEEEVETCDATCIEGACTECVPTQLTKCSHNSVRSCSATGTWTETPCPADAPQCSGGVCENLLSCSGLAKICGPTAPVGAVGENCCVSPLVIGGTFNRDNNSGLPATISTFRLDRFEVTVGRFRRFKAAWDGGWRPSAGDGKHTHLNDGKGLSTSPNLPGYEYGWRDDWSDDVSLVAATLVDLLPYATWTQTSGTGESRPMNYVTVIEAQAFCIWDGGFLPSGAEWSYAASGGDEQRLYPWGDEVPGANLDLAVYGCCGQSGIRGVGSVGVPGRFGQLDLAGNLAERTLGTTNPPVCTDCVSQPNLFDDAEVDHGVRGGSYASSAAEVTSGSHVLGDAGERDTQTGFRCARPP